VQADSPSFALLLAINEAGCQGLSRGALEARFTDEILVIPRINDLVTGGLVRHTGQQYVSEKKGSILARVHLIYRGLLNLEKGG